MACACSTVTMALVHRIQLPWPHQNACRAAHELLQSQRLESGNDAIGAKLRASQALRLAHREVGSAPLTVQALNALAPLLARAGDRPGAEQMLATATTLAQSLGDPVSLIATLQLALDLSADAAASEAFPEVQRTQAVLEAQQNDLQSRIAAAQQSERHAQLSQMLGIAI